MMTESTATVAIDGEERDVEVRAEVAIEPGLGMGGAWGAVLDGDAEARVDGSWVPVDSLSLDAGDVESIEEALCVAAIDAWGERRRDARERDDDEWVNGVRP